MMVPNYDHSILNVIATILKHYQAPTCYQGLPILEEAIKDKKHIVLVLLDGMGINVIHKHLFKDAFFIKHMKGRHIICFSSNNCSSDNNSSFWFTPYQSGHLGWVQYFPKEDMNIALFPNQDFL